MPGHARTPGRHQRLGGPLPRQQPNTTTARPTAPKLWYQTDAGLVLRWGLPAVSRGYTRPWGWLPSPYSPFRHWPDLAAGPVRLACLIHAANVHSEPGSNPSKKSGKDPRPRRRGLKPAAPHPEGLRKKNWSHQAPGPKRRAALKTSGLLPVSCEPSLGSPGLRTTEPGPPARTTARRLPSRVPHNATDERVIHRVCACFLVFWLTSAINRIVKELAIGCAAISSTPQLLSLFTGPHRYHRPVQAALRHPAPAGMIRPRLFQGGKSYNSPPLQKVKGPAHFFSLQRGR